MPTPFPSTRSAGIGRDIDRRLHGPGPAGFAR